MAHSVSQLQPSPRPLAEMVERHDVLRMIMDWVVDRFIDVPAEDTSIAWEDGEEHDEPPARRP